MPQAYCVKCGEKRDMQNPQEARTKNDRKMLKGKCPVCGSGMSLFVKG